MQASLLRLSKTPCNCKAKTGALRVAGSIAAHKTLRQLIPSHVQLLLVSELEVSLGLIDDFRDGRRRIRHFSASPDGDVLVPEGEILLEGRETQ